VTKPRHLLLGTNGAAKPVRFLVVPTGQVISNIVPLFELVRPGDSILWLATPEANAKGWLARSRAAVALRFPAVQQEDLTDLPETLDAWGERQERFRELCAVPQLVFVVNGGTKPLLLALAAALAAAGHATCPVAYTSMRPPGLILQPGGYTGPTLRVGYGADTCIGLEEVLIAANYCQMKGTRGRRVWSARDRVALPKPGAYGTDPEATFDLHRAAWAHHGRSRLVAGGIDSFAGSRFDAGAKATMRGAVRAYTASPQDDAALAILFNTFRKRGIAAEQASRSVMEGVAEGAALEQVHELPECLEAAVAQRAVALVANAPELSSRVAEIWRNVTVATADDPSRLRAEFDLLILLRHGVALHLDSKSALAQFDDKKKDFAKDMDARIHNLRQASSRVAKLMICMPAYTAAAGEDWMSRLAQDWQQKVSGRYESMFFTLPNQQTEMELDGETIVIESFETTLGRVILTN